MSRQWKSSFCSLDPQVDEDHRNLFRLLDRLATHRRESDLEELNPLLGQVLDYTFEHFAREEASMLASDYPKVQLHIEQHLVIRKALIESLRRVAKGEVTLAVFIEHLKDSFMYHFETDDMTFVTWQRHHQALAHKPEARHLEGSAPLSNPAQGKPT